jgi:hypothetical protein
MARNGTSLASIVSVACACALSLRAATARAADVGDLGGDEVQLDVTETSIVAQRFDARGNEALQDSGWGTWINRLDAALRWERWTAGLRLDSSVFWRRPIDNPNYQTLRPSVQSQIQTDNESRYQNSIYPAKLWVTYTAPGVEVTAGDAYVQFGRGLTLSMRKIDELGIDTTVRGAKIQLERDPFALTLIAGFGNPSRIDEATGRELFPTHDLVAGDRSVPAFGSDRVVGAELQAGRGLPVTLSTHAVQFTRCAPYHYDANGNLVTDVWRDPAGVTFGSCNPDDTAQWLGRIGHVPPPLDAREITMAGQSLEVPSLWGHGKLYVEAAAQQRHYVVPEENRNTAGNALYAALSVDASSVTTTLEVKSNRNFYAVPASVDPNTALEFSVVAYSFLPPAETFNMIDAEGTGNFNSCVDGGRFRVDVGASKALTLYAQGIYAYSKAEESDGGCDAQGHTISTVPADKVQDRVWDGIAGVEWYSADKLSHAFAWAGARDDVKESGDWTYREQHLEYSIAKYLGGPWSLEIQGRHRHRREETLNAGGWWWEGENYVALRMAPKWVFTQGFEYTTQIGQPVLYFNGAVLFKFTSSSNVRVFVGQQRGAFRCASGICRYFPAFEGARAELTWRF